MCNVHVLIYIRQKHEKEYNMAMMDVLYCNGKRCDICC